MATKRHFSDEIDQNLAEFLRAEQEDAEKRKGPKQGEEVVQASTARKRLQDNPKGEIKRLGLDQFLEGAVSPEVKAKMRKKFPNSGQVGQ
ncbi:MAG: hypothetical protein J3T61_08280 [Candidatus Brocadiales bacterium]|nr:hypothetical protein [Candidatus Bathyanammoxibius sp.]